MVKKQRTSVLILGAALMQIPIIHAAKRHNCKVIVADGNKNAIAKEYADEFCHIDLRDIDALIDKALQLDINGVCTAATDFTYAVSRIANACNIPGISLSSAYNSNYKHAMRSVFTSAKVPSPEYCVVNTKKSISKNIKNTIKNTACGKTC